MIWQNLKTIFQRRINQINKDDNIKIEYKILINKKQ
jgi:hypothetical protein